MAHVGKNAKLETKCRAGHASSSEPRDFGEPHRLVGFVCQPGSLESEAPESKRCVCKQNLSHSILRFHFSPSPRHLLKLAHLKHTSATALMIYLDFKSVSISLQFGSISRFTT